MFILNEFDSDYLKIPRVPFIVELPTLCFKVHVSMSLAAQQEELPYFELIQSPINSNGETKNIGHKCLNFYATCSIFILRGNGYIIYSEPYDWHYDREIDLKNNILSLDDDPATGYEAWEIYSAYERHKDSNKVKQMIEHLNTDQITFEHIKKHFPDFIGHYKTSNRINQELIDVFEKAVGTNALRDKKIHRKKKRVEISEINLLMSYQHILSQQSSKNKDMALREAIFLFYPDVAPDSNEFDSKYNALKNKIKYHLKNSEEMDFYFPNPQENNPIDKIRHHFENNKNEEDQKDQEDEFILILELLGNLGFK